MTRERRIRLFLDSNILTGGIIAQWGLDKAVLSVCAAGICRMVLAEAVRDEVDLNLLTHAERLRSPMAQALIADYHRLLVLTEPEIVPYPRPEAVRASRHLIRHDADVPVLLSAITCKPDWLLTHNTKHFTQGVAAKTALRIGTPAEFFRSLAETLR